MKKNLSVNDFTNWISQQEEMANFFGLTPRKQENNMDTDSLVGKSVFLKVSSKKFHEKAELQDGENEKKVFTEFKMHGGEVVEYVGKNLLIKTDSGSLLLPRFCVTE